MPLEVLINKMTGQTADRYRIKNRGYLKEGYYADLVVMDAEGVTDDPESLKPRGIHEVYVNGEAVIKGDSLNFQGTGSGIAIQ